VFLVKNAEQWLIDDGQTHRSAYLGHGDFLSVQEEISVQKPARFEVSPGKDKERTVCSVDGFLLCIVIQE